jgi:hypothetical protein
LNSKQHKQFPWLWYSLALFVIVAFAFAPIGSVMLCGRDRERVRVQGGRRLGAGQIFSRRRLAVLNWWTALAARLFIRIAFTARRSATK